ncbi:hypothetical protein GBA52_026236, partial [Prunus armeniaca]
MLMGSFNSSQDDYPQHNYQLTNNSSISDLQLYHHNHHHLSLPSLLHPKPSPSKPRLSSPLKLRISSDAHIFRQLSLLLQSFQIYRQSFNLAPSQRHISIAADCSSFFNQTSTHQFRKRERERL